MSGKCRPSLRKKTLANVVCSNLSTTDKECIKAVFERYTEPKRGRWEKSVVIRTDTSVLYDYTCSECRIVTDRYSNFCPNCGAKMDGERKNETNES